MLAWIFAVMFAFRPLSHLNAFDTKAGHFVFFSLLTEALLLSCYNNQANSRTGSWFPSCKEDQQNGFETEALSTEAPCPGKKWLLLAFLAQMGEEGHHLKAGINPDWTEPWITTVAKEKEGAEIQKEFFLSRLHSSQFTYGSYTMQGYNAENLLSETPSKISTQTFCGWLCRCIIFFLISRASAQWRSLCCGSCLHQSPFKVSINRACLLNRYIRSQLLVSQAEARSWFISVIPLWAFIKGYIPPLCLRILLV